MYKYVILIVISVCLVYANSLFNGFVYDDDLVIVENDFIKSSRNLILLFNRRYLTHPHEVDSLGFRDIGAGEASYRPIATLSYFLNYAIFRLNPFGWHLVNILLHSSCAVLVFFLLNYLFNNPQLSFFASIVFGIHPVNVEVINCSAFRPNTLAFLFSLFTIILYFKYSYNLKSLRRKRYLLGSLFFFMSALFSKEIAIVLPLALILCDYFKNELSFKGLKKKTKFYLLYLLPLFFYFYVYFFIFPPTIKNFVPPESFYKGIWGMFNVFGFYFKDLLLPVDLTFVSAYFTDYSLGMTIFAIMLTIASFYIIFLKRRVFKAVSFAAIWFFIWLLPMNNFVVPFRIPAAYRYLYIPMLGFSVVLGIFLLKLWNADISFMARDLRISRVLVLAILIYFSINTFSANFLWKDDLVLHLAHVKKYPKNLRAHAALGLELLNRGNLEAAQKEYEYVVSVSRDLKNQHEPLISYISSYLNLGKIYKEKGNYSKAEEIFREANIKFPGSRAQIYTELGILHIQQGLYKDALEYFRLSKEEDHLNYSAYVASGISYALLGQTDQARAEWLRALEINPDCEDAKRNLKKLEEDVHAQ